MDGGTYSLTARVQYSHSALETNNLQEAVLALVIQCLIGTFVDAVMVGCIFIKLSKPTNRTDTLIFSTDAVISQVESFPLTFENIILSAMENTA